MSFGELLRALSFAAQAHREHKRKGTGEPYINHLIDVAELLARFAQVVDVEILSAAVLHDVVEDTSVSAADVEREFGARVRVLVEALTDDKNLPKAERKRLQIEHMHTASDDVRCIKLADHCSNIATLPAEWSRERKLEYLDWSAQVAAACAGAQPALEREHRARWERARAELDADA
jgi:GTP diphosphokinase / guanosine-3',5'-bis(diphosphate) 3'-diphosphatase